MKFSDLEVGKLYVAGNDDEAKDCLIRCEEIYYDYAYFKVVKGNDTYYEGSLLNYGEKFISDERFKLLPLTKDDVHECKGITTQEKVDALEEYCEERVCGNCMFEGTCNDWYDYDDDGNQTLREYGIDVDYKKLVACKCKDYPFFREVADRVNHPAHYQGKYECIDVMLDVYGEEATTNFCICNAFKYIWRHNHKDGKQDIEKCMWYLKKYMELKYGESKSRED